MTRRHTSQTSQPQSSAASDEVSALLATSDLLRVIAGGRFSRADLGRMTGLSRMTLGQRLAMLIDYGLVEELAETVPSGGRPTKMLGLKTSFGVILSADLGESQIRLGITDIAGTLLARSSVHYKPEDGPESALELISSGLAALIDGFEKPPFPVGIGVSMPAPTDAAAGEVMGPSILRGWDGFHLVDWLETAFGIPAVVENDVNLMTLFEASRSAESTDYFLFIKMGTGIGSGLIAGGELYRGANGASGDIGHVQLIRDQAPLCRCGKVGCLEAHAAGWAIARDLRTRGIPAQDAHDVVALVEQHVPEAIDLVRKSGRALGEVVAECVSILNPKVIRIGGTLAAANEYLLAGVREMVYQRCLPLATNSLVIESSLPDERGCLIGAALLVADRQLTKRPLEPMLNRYYAWSKSV